jgi:hypothetical protein
VGPSDCAETAGCAGSDLERESPFGEIFARKQRRGSPESVSLVRWPTGSSAGRTWAAPEMVTFGADNLRRIFFQRAAPGSTQRGSVWGEIWQRGCLIRHRLGRNCARLGLILRRATEVGSTRVFFFFFFFLVGSPPKKLNFVPDVEFLNVTRLLDAGAGSSRYV